MFLRRLQDQLGFNPRPRTEGDDNIIEYFRGINGFNPRPRTEGDRFAFPDILW